MKVSRLLIHVNDLSQSKLKYTYHLKFTQPQSYFHTGLPFLSKDMTRMNSGGQEQPHMRLVAKTLMKHTGM